MRNRKVLTMDEDSIAEADKVGRRIWTQCRQPARLRCRPTAPAMSGP
jgi:hypothetical protein